MVQALTPGHKTRPSFQNNQSKKGLGCESSGRAPAQQVQSPEFKPHNCQNKLKKNKNNNRAQHEELRELCQVKEGFLNLWSMN
jgi:hypothetical protein